MIKIFIFLGLTASCSSVATTEMVAPDSLTRVQTAVETKQELVEWVDTVRDRSIPLAFYSTVEAGEPTVDGKKIVIFSHGYGRNSGESYLKYNRLLRYFADCGYFVVSIQYELPTDKLMPLNGNIWANRKPFWDRGEETLLYVLNRLKGEYPQLDYSDVTLIGHSNGGDISCQFTTNHPDLVTRLITLDNLRVPLPLSEHVQVASLRADDTKADEGVIPDAATQKKWSIEVLQLKGVGHSDMDDKATDSQMEELLDAFKKCLPC